jgi:hypothetical protein
VKKGAAWLAALVKREPVLTAAILGGVADTVQAGIRDNITGTEMIRSVVYVVAGIIIRAKVSPTTSSTPAGDAPADTQPPAAPQMLQAVGWGVPARKVDEDGYPDTGAHRFHP